MGVAVGTRRVQGKRGCSARRRWPFSSPAPVDVALALYLTSSMAPVPVPGACACAAIWPVPRDQGTKAPKDPRLGLGSRVSTGHFQWGAKFWKLEVAIGLLGDSHSDDPCRPWASRGRPGDVCYRLNTTNVPLVVQRAMVHALFRTLELPSLRLGLPHCLAFQRPMREQGPTSCSEMQSASRSS